VATTTVEGFSISHAVILDGATGLEEDWGDIYGVREGSLDVDTANYDNTGDDFVLSRWMWFNFATVTITAGYVPFETIASMTGAALTSSGAAPNDYYDLPLWTEDSLNQPTRPMLIRVPSKDSDGMVRNLDFVLFKVQFNPISFSGPAYKDGLVLNYGGTALISSVDEAGTTLPKRAIGRMVSRPTA
jgi:hypothetical protein